MQNTIIYLIGFPGAGKYTVGKEIAFREPFVVVDNHLINNPIFSLIRVDGKTPLPKTTWSYVDKIWSVVLDAIVNLAPKENSFILTNALFDDDPGDYDHYDRIKGIAEKRDAVFVPVRLLLSDVGEHVKRITSPERGDRMKQTCGEAPAKYASERKLIEISHANLLTLETSGMTAPEVAEKVLEHIKKCIRA